MFIAYNRALQYDHASTRQVSEAISLPLSERSLSISCVFITCKAPE